jgi:hypothetical protein
MIFLQIFILVLAIIFLGLIIFESIKYISTKNKRRVIDAENNPDKAAVVLIDDLNNTKNEIDIVTGNANPTFYSRKDVYDKLEEVAKDKKIINIYSGKPSTRFKGKNPLVKLSEDYPRVNFYQIDTEYLQPHFRIIDNLDVFVERNHAKGNDNRFYCYFANDRFLARKYKEKLKLLQKNLSNIS